MSTINSIIGSLSISILIKMKNLIKIEKSNNNEKLGKDTNKKIQSKFRRLQAIYGQKSILLCIPIEFTQDLGLAKGDMSNVVLTTISN